MAAGGGRNPAEGGGLARRGAGNGAGLSGADRVRREIRAGRRRAGGARAFGGGDRLARAGPVGTAPAERNARPRPRLCRLSARCRRLAGTRRGVAAAGTAISGGAFDGRLHRFARAGRARRLGRRGLFGADVGAEPAAADPRGRRDALGARARGRARRPADAGNRPPGGGAAVRGQRAHLRSGGLPLVPGAADAASRARARQPECRLDRLGAARGAGGGARTDARRAGRGPARQRGGGGVAGPTCAGSRGACRRASWWSSPAGVTRSSWSGRRSPPRPGAGSTPCWRRERPVRGKRQRETEAPGRHAGRPPPPPPWSDSDPDRPGSDQLRPDRSGRSLTPRR